MRINPRWTILTLAVALAGTACTAEVEEEGEMPDVEVTGGQAPDVDVDPANVTVGSDTQTVVTPDVDVSAPDGN